jgi:hypothetical protein
MPDRAMDVYLNDHLAGATLGSDLAKQIQKRHEQTPLGDLMDSLAPEIEEDRQTLIRLMEELDVSQNPIKQVTGWLTEKASLLKFSGVVSGEPDHGAFMALETLALGVEGKRSLWVALQQVQSQYPPLTSTSLEELIGRAEAQHAALESERLAAGMRALGTASDE